MKKWIIFISIFSIIFVLSACNNDSNVENSDQNDLNENGLENEQNNTELIESNDEDVDNEFEKDEVNNNNTTENENNNNQAEDDDSDDKTTEDILKEKTYKIFAAQREYDYDYLASVLSEGSELDKENDMLIFNNVTYPHEQPLLEEVAEDDLEYRYFHEESETSMVVGFAAIDYEEESSFVIDFEYVLENEEWKMNDMDINK